MSTVVRKVRQLDEPKPVSNVEAVVFDLKQLAQAVYRSDSLDVPLTTEQIEVVLEVALKKVGLFCISGETAVLLDLSNGYHLSCRALPAGARR